MILPTPEVPFSRIKFIGESVTIEGEWDTIVFLTGHPYLLPNCNEYTLTEGRTLTEGTHTFTDDHDENTGLRNWYTSWFTVYDSTTKEADFFYFSHHPKRLQFTVSSSGKITQLVLYSGNGTISHGRAVYPSLTVDYNNDLVPDFLTLIKDGSITNFLKSYSCVGKEVEIDQYILDDGTTFTTIDGDTLYIQPSIDNFNTSETIIVNENTTICNVPPDFASLSMEHGWVCTMYSNPTKSAQLLNTLGVGVIRIGGLTGDYCGWVGDGTGYCKLDTSPTKDPTTGIFVDPTPVDTPAGSANRTVFSESIISNIKEMYDLTNWKIILGLNFVENNPTLFAEEAAYASSVLGPILEAVEVGNETDSYISPYSRDQRISDPDWDINTYFSEWEAYRTAIPSNINIVGPDTTDPIWLNAFGLKEHQNITGLTMHYYPTGHGKTGLSDPSPESILGKQNLRKTIDTFDTLRTYAQSVNVPLILGETNSASGGGEDGTSNTFVSCLWAVDYLFTALEKGVRRAHFHGTFSTSGDGSTSYAPIGADLNPRPLYYGLLCFRKAAPNGICVPVTTDSLVNVRGHATIGIDGKLRVTIVNKDLNLDAVLQIRTKNVYTHAEVQFLTAPSTSSKTEITFCGNSVASDGTWSPGAATTLTSIGNHTSVTVPVANIAIVTFW